MGTRPLVSSARFDRRRRAVILAAVLASAGVTFARRMPIAHAQSSAELEAARQLYTEGLELEKKKDYGAALEKFRKVLSIKSTAIVRYHEGYCLEKEKKWVDALDAYSRAMIEGQGDPKAKTAVYASSKAA